MSNSIRLSLDVSPSLYSTIDHLARQAGTTKADLFRKAIALFEVAAEAALKGQSMVILNADDTVYAKIAGLGVRAPNPAEPEGVRCVCGDVLKHEGVCAPPDATPREPSCATCGGPIERFRITGNWVHVYRSDGATHNAVHPDAPKEDHRP